jgi:hypothetical protein
LTCHRVNHKQFLRLDCFVNTCNLIHHFLVNCKPACCIYDYDIESICLSMLNCILCNFNWILIFWFGIPTLSNLPQRVAELLLGR